MSQQWLERLKNFYNAKKHATLEEYNQALIQTKDSYLKLLEESFAQESDPQMSGMVSETRLVFLGTQIFNFTTYDDGMTDLFTRKAVEVVRAVNDRTTFEYIKASTENYQWYLLMCNMPFFADKLEWGTSVRGAWWDITHPHREVYKLNTCGLWKDGDQVEPEFKEDDEWTAFMQAVVEFAATEMTTTETNETKEST